MEIKVFGPGCARCTEAEQVVRQVVAAKGVAATVVKVTDLKEMMQAGVMSTPAVSVDGVVKCTGRVPTRDDISAWIDGAASPTASADAASGGAAGTTSGCCCGGKC